MPQFHMSDRFLSWYDILNICTDGTTTRYGMRHDLAFWVIEVRYWQDISSRVNFFQTLRRINILCFVHFLLLNVFIMNLSRT
jgi:hypothetical protein